MVIDGVRAHGRSTIVEEITPHVKANECACEVKNPAGRCCLGECDQGDPEGPAAGTTGGVVRLATDAV